MFAVGVIAILGGVLAMLVTREERVHTVSETSTEGDELRVADERPGLLPATPVRAEVATEETVESFLASYWGPQWDDIKDKYLSRGVSLTSSMTSTELQPWEEIEEEVQSLARAYYERDLQLTRSFFLGRVEESASFLEKFGVPEDMKDEVLSGLKPELADLDSQLESLSNQYIAVLDGAMSSVISQDPERCPLVDLRESSVDPRELSEVDLRALNEKAGGGAVTIQVELGGWYVAYRCLNADFPLLSELQNERQKLVGQRNTRMRDFINNPRMRAYIKKSTGR